MAEAEVSILIRAKDEATKTLQGIQGNIEGMSKQLKIAGAAMVVTGGAIVAGLTMAAKAAAEEEAGIAKLSTAMANVGISYETNKASLEAYIDAQMRTTAYADDEQRAALAALIPMTGDLAKAQELLSLSMDLARWKGMGLVSASEIVGKVSAGNTGILSRYGIVVKEGATATDALAQMQSMCAGQAETYGKTTSGQLDILKNSVDDVKESIGAVLTTALSPLMQKVTEFIPKIQEWIAQHPTLVKALTLGALALGLILIPLGTFLIMLPMLASGIGMVTTAASPWLIIIIAVIAGLAALVAIGVLVYKNWDKICEWAGKVRDWFVKLGDTIMGGLKKALDWLKDMLDKLISPFKTAWDWINKLIKGSGLEDLTRAFDAAAWGAEAFGGALVSQAQQADVLAKSVDGLTASTKDYTAVMQEEYKIATQYRGLSYEEQLKKYEEEGGYAPWVSEKAIAADITAAYASVGRQAANQAIIAGAVATGTWGAGAVAAAQSVSWYQRGGVVPRTGLAILHAGETVLPADTMITIPIYLDGDLIAKKMIKRIGNKLQLQGVT
jgi:hypothetical protein